MRFFKVSFYFLPIFMYCSIAQTQDNILDNTLFLELVPDETNIHTINLYDSFYKFTDLQRAVILGRLRAVERLISEGVDVNETNVYGQTALHWAAMMRHDKIVDRLKSAGADVNIADELNFTPLHSAASRGYNFFVRRFTSFSGGADLEARTNYEETPLWLACLNNHTQVMASLISAGADVNVRKGNLTLARKAIYNYESAVMYGPVAEMIISSYAEPADNRMNRVGFQGRTRRYGCLAMLLEAGVDVVNDIDAETEKNLLHAALDIGHSEFVLDALLAAGVPVNGQDKEENTPLHYLGFYGREGLAALFVEYGADVRIKNCYGSPPYFWDRKKDRIVHYRDGAETLWDKFVEFWTHPERTFKYLNVQ